MSPKKRQEIYNGIARAVCDARIHLSRMSRSDSTVDEIVANIERDAWANIKKVLDAKLNRRAAQKEGAQG